MHLCFYRLKLKSGRMSLGWERWKHFFISDFISNCGGFCSISHCGFLAPENRSDFYFLTGYPASLTSNLREKASSESNVCFFKSRRNCVQNPFLTCIRFKKDIWSWTNASRIVRNLKSGYYIRETGDGSRKGWKLLHFYDFFFSLRWCALINHAH